MGSTFTTADHRHHVRNQHAAGCRAPIAEHQAECAASLGGGAIRSLAVEREGTTSNGVGDATQYVDEGGGGWGVLVHAYMRRRERR